MMDGPALVNLVDSQTSARYSVRLNLGCDGRGMQHQTAQAYRRVGAELTSIRCGCSPSLVYTAGGNLFRVSSGALRYRGAARSGQPPCVR